MKKVLLLLTLAVVFASCGNNTGEKKVKSADNKTASEAGVQKTVVKLDSNDRVFKKYVNGQHLLVMKYKKTGKKEYPIYQKEYYENGQVSKEGPLVDVKKNGLWKSYYKTGELRSEFYYKDGYIDSVTTAYHKNGKIRYKGQFHKSRKTGVWEFFNEQGELTDTKDYSRK